MQFEFRHLSPEHREAVLGLRKEIDGVVAGVLRDGEFAFTQYSNLLFAS